MRLTLAVGLIMLFSLGCGNGEVRVEHTVVSNISRVFMHLPGEYTFFVEAQDNKVSQLKIKSHGKNVTIVEDLKKGEPIRVEYSNCRGYQGCLRIPANFSYWSVFVDDLTIHLHTSSEIDGAGWERKFGKNRTEKGTTDVIE